MNGFGHVSQNTFGRENYVPVTATIVRTWAQKKAKMAQNSSGFLVLYSIFF